MLASFHRALCLPCCLLGLVLTACPSSDPVPATDTGSTDGSTDGSTSPADSTSSSADGTSSTDGGASDSTTEAVGTTEDLDTTATETTGEPTQCGDGIVAGDEQCDGADLAGGTCEGQGFARGTLGCDDTCAYDVSACSSLPDAPVLVLTLSQVKRFDFSWAAATGADYYQLEESRAPGEPFLPLGEDILGTSVSHTMPLHFRWQASYRLRACNVEGCTESAVVDVMGSLADAVGYVKASNSDPEDEFGNEVALSADGNTLVVSSYEDSSAAGIDGDQADDSTFAAGAVYVFVRDAMGTWSQQAYIKASNPGSNDRFGSGVALSANGNTLAVGAYQESSSATGIGGDQADDSAFAAGAVYVFVRDGAGTWSQQAYVKASNAGSFDLFGRAVDLSADGNTLAVGAPFEDSNATGIDGDQLDASATSSGAAYVFVREATGTWLQQAYIKASNTGAEDWFGNDLALSDDGNTLAVGAPFEDGNATGIGGDQASNAAAAAGAAYVFVRDATSAWSQQAYIKASNTGADDWFGFELDLSADGNTLAVGAPYEDSSATGIDGDQASNAAASAGAAYVFGRDGVGAWSQQAYVKASNTDANDWLGFGVALSGDGSTLAVGAHVEASNASGLQGNQADDSAGTSGAAYVFALDGAGAWSQQAYVKASNSDVGDYFGFSVALDGDGHTLAVGAFWEDGSATGIGGDQADDSAMNAGAVYLY